MYIFKAPIQLLPLSLLLAGLLLRHAR